MRKLFAIVCAGFVAVCATGCRIPPPKDEDAFSWTADLPPPAANGSVYQSGRDMALFENPVARHVGDIVTIILNEQTAAQKSAVTTTSKATTDATSATLLGKAVTLNGAQILNNSINDANKFDGEGNSQQSNSLTGNVTATVTKVLPNGNLYIKGEKWIEINQGTEYVKLSGVVRPIDLSPSNTISSAQVGNAKISYGGKGALADANTMGWLARFFNSPWSPF